MPSDRPRDTSELDEWVVTTSPRAVAYATSLLKDRDQAEDVVQDCYCRLLAKAEVYDLPRDGLKILMRSITNACINRQTRRRRMFRLYRVGDNGDGSDQLEDPRDVAAASPDEVAVAGELKQAIVEGLARLPEKQRAALELRSLGHTQQDVAEIMEISLSHAGVLIHRARQTIARFLAPYLEPDSQI